MITRSRWILKSNNSRLFLIAVSLSLLLLLATLALWARGYSARDGVWYSNDRARYSLQTYRGRIWYWELSGGHVTSDYVWNTPTKLHAGWVWDSAPNSYYDRFRMMYGGRGLSAEQFTIDAPAMGYSPADPHAANWQALGFRYLHTNGWVPIAQLSWNYPTARSTAVFIPHWAIAATFAFLPATAMFAALRRRHRAHRGLCQFCGYDLRASEDRCPECGASKSA